MTNEPDSNHQVVLFNSLTRQKETFQPATTGEATVYSCGPTVYDHVHIGNLRSFIITDTLVRMLSASGHNVHHVMNITDVDDKTIARSQEEYPDQTPADALTQLTQQYERVFLDDTAQAGIDYSNTRLVKATDHIPHMTDLIKTLLEKQYAYQANDGVYFSIDTYNGQYHYGETLVNLSGQPVSNRISNDEYDKNDVADFALWKRAQPHEPSWELTVNDQIIPGRPGWHIECSAMSTKYLGQPFDIHTGGTDLKFPHHVNEIAQSKAATGQDLARYFVHNEHVLVEGSKMSKSLGNFHTLVNITDRGYNPLAFRLLTLQTHYRSQQNFTWPALEGAQNFLQKLYMMADRQFQPSERSSPPDVYEQFKQYYDHLMSALRDDLDTPQAIATLGELADFVESIPIAKPELDTFVNTLKFVDAVLGLRLSERQDVAQQTHQRIRDREQARQDQDYQAADEIRQTLADDRLGLNDTPHGTYWYRML